MKYLQNESGIEINESLKQLILKAIEKEGKQSKLARKIGTSETNISTWLGNSAKKVSSITWDRWAKVREYLLKENLIEADDPRWMLPSQLRQVALAAREREARLRQLASSFMVDIGAATADIAMSPDKSSDTDIADIGLTDSSTKTNNQA